MAYDLPIVSRTRRNQITKLAGNIGTTSFVDGLGPPPAPPTAPPSPPTGGFQPTGFQPRQPQSPLVPTAAPAPIPSPGWNINPQSGRIGYTGRPDITQLPYEGVPIEGMAPDIQAAAWETDIVQSQREHDEALQRIRTYNDLVSQPAWQQNKELQRLRQLSGLPAEPYRGPMNATEAFLEPFAMMEEYTENVAQNIIYGAMKILPGNQSPGGREAERRFNAWAAAGSTYSDDPLSADAPKDMSWAAQRERIMDQERQRQLMTGTGYGGPGLTTQQLLEGTREPGSWTPGGWDYAIQKSIEEKALPWYVTEPIKVLVDPLELILAPAAKPLIVSAGVLARRGGRGVITIGGAGVTRLPGASVLSKAMIRSNVAKTPQATELEKIDKAIASLTKRADDLVQLQGSDLYPTFKWPQTEKQMDKVRAQLGALGAQKSRILNPPTSDIVYRVDPWGSLSVAAKEQLVFDSGPFGGAVWMPELTFAPQTKLASYLDVGLLPESQPFIGPRLAGNANVHLDGPNRYGVDLPEKAKHLFWFDPIRGGLTNMQNVGATISDMTRGVSRWGMHFDEHGTAAGAALRNNFMTAKRVAAAKSRMLADYAFSAFEVNDDGYIMSLANDIEGYPIDESIRGTAPTIQDVAARMPTYLPHLNANQIDAMTHLKRFSDEMNEALTEMGWPPPQDRTDVMDGGFYLHRGSPRPVGEKWKFGPISKEVSRETPVSVSSYWRTKSSYRHAEGFNSMAEAMQGVTYTRPEDTVKGFKKTEYHTSFKYPNFREAMRSYIQQVGEDIAQVHSQNYLEIAVDTDTGVRLAIDTKKYLDPIIKKQHGALVRNMQGARESLRRVIAQSTILRENVARAYRTEGAQTQRGARATKQAATRAERQRERVTEEERFKALPPIAPEVQARLMPTAWEIVEVRRNLRGAINSAKAITGNVAVMKQEIRQNRRLLKDTDTQIIKLQERAEKLSFQAEEHYNLMAFEQRPTPAQLQLTEETEYIQETINKLKDIRSWVPEKGMGDDETFNALKLRELESALQELSDRVTGRVDVLNAIHDYRVVRTEKLKATGARDTLDIEADMARSRNLLNKAEARANTREETLVRHNADITRFEEELGDATRNRKGSEAEAMETRRLGMVWRQVDRLKITEITSEELGKPIRQGAGGDLVETGWGPETPYRRKKKPGKRKPRPAHTPPKEEGPARDFANAVNLADELDVATNDLLEQSDILQRELDDMATQESKLADELTQSNESIRRNANRERLLLKQEHSLSSMRRALRNMEIEYERIVRVMDKEEELAIRSTASEEARAVKKELQIQKYGVKMDKLQAEIDSMAVEWKKSLEVARRPIPHDMVIPLPGLGGYYFPDTVANAARVYMRDVEPGILGKAYDGFNSLYRGARGTMDNSYMLVQGLLRMYDNPQKWKNALELSYKAWGLTRDELKGERAIDAFFRHASEKAVEKGLPTPDEMAAHGLVVTGADTEFMLGRGFAAFLADVPIIRNANRAFGATGDAMRVEWAYDMLEGMLKTKTLRQIIDDGDMADMVGVINNATGWSKARFGGAAGDLLLFAPRFLNSRFETLVKAVRGAPSLIPGLTRPYGQEGGGINPTVGQRIAARSMLKMAAGAATMTHLLNTMQGRETDWNPVRKIGAGTAGERWIKNSNFMRINAFGQDISLLGTWDSLLGLIITSGAILEEGGPHVAMRGMSSGGVALAWDFISGTNAVGEPIRNSKEQVGYRLLSTFMPFSGEEILGRPGPGTGQIGEMQKFMNQIGYDQEELHEKGETTTWGMRGKWGLEIMGRVGMSAFELHGGKSYPMSTREELMELRLEHGRNLLERGDFERDSTGRIRSNDEMEQLEDVFSQDAWFLKWGDVPADVRRLINADPEIDTLSTLRQEELVHRNDQLTQYRTKVEERKDGRNQQILGLQMKFGNEDPTGPWRNGEALREGINKADRDYALDLQRLKEDNAQLLAGLERTEEPDAYFDKAFARWAQLMYADPALEDNLGRRNWDQADANEAQFISEYGESMKASIRAFLDENDPPIVQEMDRLKKLIEPYWEVADEAQDVLLSDPSIPEKNKQELRDWLRLRKSNPQLAKLLRNTHIVSAYNEIVDSVRVTMTSEGHPGGGEMDAARIKLGYGGSPKDLRSIGGAEELIGTMLEGEGSR